MSVIHDDQWLLVPLNADSWRRDAVWTYPRLPDECLWMVIDANGHNYWIIMVNSGC